MSFGRPPGFSTLTATAPDRGSFPLDHEGECKSVMSDYMKCLKANKHDSGECRALSRKYLECRMEKGLMEKDEMKNLGFQGNERGDLVSSTAAAATTAAENQGTRAASDSRGGQRNEVQARPSTVTERI